MLNAVVFACLCAANCSPFLDMKRIFIDSEGEPCQEFTALYADMESKSVIDIFHCHVAYPTDSYDCDWWARRYIHGLKTTYLRKNGVKNVEELVENFTVWLSTRPHDGIYAHAPRKEIDLLRMPVSHVALLPWKERRNDPSHELAVDMKLTKKDVCGVHCNAHNVNTRWRPKNAHSLTMSDIAKINFSFHCSLYDAAEIFFFSCAQ